jgi:hypothetical protein
MPSQKMEYQFQTPSVVVLSDEERLSGHMTMENVGHAVAALHRDGLVVLENAVEPTHMDNLNDILCPEAEEMAKLPTTHFNNVSLLLFSLLSHADQPLQELEGWQEYWKYEPGAATGL